MTATLVDREQVDSLQGLPAAVSAIARLQELRSDASTGWEWQTLEDELNRREAESVSLADNNDDEDESTLVPNDDDPKKEETTTKSLEVNRGDTSPETSIDEVIRKVSLLRTPLNYDEPEETPKCRQKRWLAAALEAIEMERLRNEIHQETRDDASRDPHPGADANVVQHTFITPARREARRARSTSVERRDDDERDDISGGGSTSRKKDDQTTDHERKKDDPPSAYGTVRAQERSQRMSKVEIDGALQLVATYEVEYQGIVLRESADHVDTENEGENRADDMEDEVESSRCEQSKHTDYVYLQIEQRTTSGDDDVSVSSMEYLFNWLTCVNADDELGQRKQLVETRGFKGKRPSAQEKPKSDKLPDDVKTKRVRSPQRNAGASSAERVSHLSSSRLRRSGGDSDLTPKEMPKNRQHRHLTKSKVQQHNLNYRPSLQLGNRSSSTINTLSTSERVASIIDRPDTWLTIGATNPRYSLSEDGEEVQLSPKRKPMLHVPEGDPLSSNHRPVKSGRARASAKLRTSKGSRLSGRSRK
jgi:hypothetical protein